MGGRGKKEGREGFRKLHDPVDLVERGEMKSGGRRKKKL